MFLLREVRTYADALPKLECGISIHATRLAGRKYIGRICDDTAEGDDGPPAGGKRRLIREGGSTSRVSDHARPRDPGAGTVLTVSPEQTIIDNVSQTVEQSVGGGGGYLRWSSPEVRRCGPNRLRLRTLPNWANTPILHVVLWMDTLDI